MSFQDKVAIVTGGSRGIGRAIVQALAAGGAKVAFTYVQNKALADEVAQGDSVVAYQADVTSFEQAKELVKQVKEKFGRIDILVNNAGITRDKLILRMSEKDWDDVIDTNLKGAFNVSKPVVAAMVSQRSGTILNITSISGMVGMPGLFFVKSGNDWLYEGTGEGNRESQHHRQRPGSRFCRNRHDCRAQRGISD
jgi:3-oxoacyl-[acyl-carrier protein] reductase